MRSHYLCPICSGIVKQKEYFKKHFSKLANHEETKTELTKANLDTREKQEGKTVGLTAVNSSNQVLTNRHDTKQAEETSAV